MNIEKIDFDLLKKTIEIYIKDAYPNGIKPTNFCYSTVFSLYNAKSREEILSIFKKERIASGDFTDDSKKTRYIAQLGSEKYPFLKLILLEAMEKDSYGFLIDRHTEYLALRTESKTYEDEIRLKQYTRELKYKIENEFIANNIPTYREIVKKMTQDLIAKMSHFNIKKNSLKVLLVDDDEDILSLYKISLELFGYNVDTADNGDDALYIFEKEYHDIMLLDLMMPTISGFEIIKLIGKNIPIIVITSLSDNNTKEECLANGAREILTKPIDTKKLDIHVKKILGQ